MSKYQSRSAIDYRSFKPMARKYLELEYLLRKLQAKEVTLKKKMYAISNEMAAVSRDHLGFLGHQVVDDMRKADNAKRTDHT